MFISPYNQNPDLAGATDSSDFTTAPGITGITTARKASDLAYDISIALTLDENDRKWQRIVTDFQLSWERAGIYDLTE